MKVVGPRTEQAGLGVGRSKELHRPGWHRLHAAIQKLQYIHELRKAVQKLILSKHVTLRLGFYCSPRNIAQEMQIGPPLHFADLETYGLPRNRSLQNSMRPFTADLLLVAPVV